MDESTRARADEASELLPDGLVSIGADRRITYLNRPAERITGLDRATAVGQDVCEALPLQDRDGSMWWQVTDPWHGIDIRTGHREKLLLLPDGTEVLATARYLRPGHNRPLSAVLLSLRDAEARRRAEADHAALISTVAHELRSPLTGVKGFSSTLLRRWDRFTDEQKRFMIETIEADADRLTRLITDLLDVSRLDAGRLRIRPQPIDVEATFARHVQRMVAAGRPADGFVIEVAPDLPEAWADPDRLDQILANLLENAVRHGRGVVRLAAAAASTPGQGPAVDFIVDDAGDGIPEANRALVFSRFWQSGSAVGSSGLGLYLVRGLAKAHGGTAVVETGPRGGALLRIRIPSEPPDYLA